MWIDREEDELYYATGSKTARVGVQVCIFDDVAFFGDVHMSFFGGVGVGLGGGGGFGRGGGERGANNVFSLAFLTLRC